MIFKRLVLLMISAALACCAYMLFEIAGTIQPSQAAAPAAPAVEPLAPIEPCQLAPAFPDAIFAYCDLIHKYASAINVDPNLLAAIILQESGGNANIISHSGAVGLMQVMPNDGIAATFQCVNGPCFAARPGTNELLDPEFNISYGANLLGSLITRTGSLREALRAYGPMDVGYYYADIILQIYSDYSG